MSDAAEIDREIAELYERLAMLHRKRAGASVARRRKRPLSAIGVKPSQDAIDAVRRGLRRKGIVA